MQNFFKKNHIYTLHFVFLILFIFLSPSAYGNEPPQINRSELPSSLSLMSNLEFILSMSILAFGIVVLLIEFRLLSNMVKTSQEDILKTLIITIIVIGSLFLITAGYSNDQIAPAMGLFGSIAGYLVGRVSKQENNEEK